MNDPAEQERKRLEKFLAGKAGGKAAPAVQKKTTTAAATAGPASPAKPLSSSSSSSYSSLSSSPSYKHEERRKWEVKQERGRAELGSPKKPLEMEDSAAESAKLRAASSASPASASVETYEERERRRRAEWKRQQSPSLALLDILESVDDNKPGATKNSVPIGSAGGSASGGKGTSSGRSSGSSGSAGRRSSSEEQALNELLQLSSGSGAAGAQASIKKEGHLSPRLQSTEETASTFQQIENVLSGLNDLLDGGSAGDTSNSSSYSKTTNAASAGKADSRSLDSIYDSSLSLAPAATTTDVSSGKAKTATGSRKTKKPQTEEERRQAKEFKREARRPQWAQSLYNDFTDGEDPTEEAERSGPAETYLWNLDLQAEEKESKEFVKDAQDGIKKLENLDSMIEPDMDVDDFDEDRFAMGMKEFFYSGRKTIRFIKRKSHQGSVRLATEAKKFIDDSVALMDTAHDFKVSRTEKAKAKFSHKVRKVKEGVKRLTKTVSTSIENEVERMRELREKVRAAERDRKEREAQEKQERESRLQTADREAKVTKLSFDVDQFIYNIKKVEDSGFMFDYNLAVEFLKRVRDIKETVPQLLREVAPGGETKFNHLTTAIEELSVSAARFVKDWQTGSKSKTESMLQTGSIVKIARKFQQDLMDLVLFI